MNERCDRCGARAVRLWFKADLQLFFCGHYSDKYSEALWDQDWLVQPPIVAGRPTALPIRRSRLEEEDYF